MPKVNIIVLVLSTQLVVPSNEQPFKEVVVAINYLPLTATIKTSKHRPILVLLFYLFDYFFFYCLHRLIIEVTVYMMINLLSYKNSAVVCLVNQVLSLLLTFLGFCVVLRVFACLVIFCFVFIFVVFVDVVFSLDQVSSIVSNVNLTLLSEMKIYQGKSQELCIFLLNRTTRHINHIFVIK